MFLSQKLSVVIIGLFWMVFVSSAPLTLEITQGVVSAVPITIPDFNSDGLVDQNLAQIIRDDLRRSGRFQLTTTANLSDQTIEQPDIAYWRQQGVENLLLGQIKKINPQEYEVQFRVFDVIRVQQIMGFTIPSPQRYLRHTAHRISDLIYEKLLGQKGVFTTKIAYITSYRQADKTLYELQIADADGQQAQSTVRSAKPLMSPAWSPDGSKLAYVSFENRHSAIYIQELATGKRQKITAFAGINGAPAWSPDGRYLALTLSKGNNPDIYILQLNTGQLQQLTRHHAIDTEAVWSPDGRSIVFTSDRGGSPQLYKISMQGGGIQRLTFEGKYNASASFAPNGKLLAFVHQVNQDFRIAVLELSSKQLKILTQGKLDESPSFAPNGSMILYATQAQQNGIVAAVSVDGQVHQNLRVQQGSVREPVWSPYDKR